MRAVRRLSRAGRAGSRKRKAPGREPAIFEAIKPAGGRPRAIWPDHGTSIRRDGTSRRSWGWESLVKPAHLIHSVHLIHSRGWQKYDLLRSRGTRDPTARGRVWGGIGRCSDAASEGAEMRHQKVGSPLRRRRGGRRASAKAVCDILRLLFERPGGIGRTADGLRSCADFGQISGCDFSLLSRVCLSRRRLRRTRSTTDSICRRPARFA